MKADNLDFISSESENGYTTTLSIKIFLGGSHFACNNRYHKCIVTPFFSGFSIFSGRAPLMSPSHRLRKAQSSGSREKKASLWSLPYALPYVTTVQYRHFRRASKKRFYCLRAAV